MKNSKEIYKILGDVNELTKLVHEDFMGTIEIGEIQYLLSIIEHDYHEDYERFWEELEQYVRNFIDGSMVTPYFFDNELFVESVIEEFDVNQFKRLYKKLTSEEM